MLITDDEAKDLKAWVISKLENISDADSDVLADYVLALIRADTPEAELRASAIENLDDFLKENTQSFVNEIFKVLHNKSYVPGYTYPSNKVSSASAVSPSSTGISAFKGEQAKNRARKRSYNDSQEDPRGQDAHYKHGDRQVKSTRRGGIHSGGYGGFGANGSNAGSTPFNPRMPIPPSMPFDPNDPMAAMLAMQAMGLPLPGAGSLPGFAVGANGHGPGKSKINARCRDYDTKGICTRGVNCPFDHGLNQIIIPPAQSEYDPKSPSMVGFPAQMSPTGQGHLDAMKGRGMGRGRGDRGGSQGSRRGNRADFSQAGPNHDRSITTVVVEQIPEENFQEESVREFFSGFGSIQEVNMQPYKRLAIVKYEDYDSARAAYESPKVIFDNRFVKVYWYNPNTLPTPMKGESARNTSISAQKPEQPEFDREKFERDAAGAQKRLEERKALQKQNKSQLAELQKQKDELAKKQADAKRELQQKLRAKGKDVPEEMVVDSHKQKENGTNGTDTEASAKTKALRTQLKALEEEAKSLGIDPEPWNSPAARSRGRGRGRGSYRGWEGFRGGYDSARGAYRGRGSFRGVPRGGGAYNLDNRPRAVKVEGLDFDESKDEGLKQHLFSVGEFTSIESSEPRTSQTITFKDRKTAEKFFYGTRDIPGVGKLEMSWVQTSLPPVTAPQSAPKDDDIAMGDSNADGTNGKLRNGGLEYQPEQEDVDYDVADDGDDWVS